MNFIFQHCKVRKVECLGKKSAFYSFVLTSKSVENIIFSTDRKGKNEMGIKKEDKMVVLACEDCKRRNYTTVKNKKNTPDRVELKKYCPFDRKHTVHKETK